MIRRIRDLLYDQGFTISGARNRLGDNGAALRLAQAETLAAAGEAQQAAEAAGAGTTEDDVAADGAALVDARAADPGQPGESQAALQPPQRRLAAADLRAELLSIRELLST